MTLHEAIINILENKNGEIHIDELLFTINQGNLYKRKDGKEINKHQIYARISNYPQFLSVANGFVRLNYSSVKSNAISDLLEYIAGMVSSEYENRKLNSFDQRIKSTIFTLLLIYCIKYEIDINIDDLSLSDLLHHFPEEQESIIVLYNYIKSFDTIRLKIIQAILINNKSLIKESLPEYYKVAIFRNSYFKIVESTLSNNFFYNESYKNKNALFIYNDLYFLENHLIFDYTYTEAETSNIDIYIALKLIHYLIHSDIRISFKRDSLYSQEIRKFDIVYTSLPNIYNLNLPDYNFYEEIYLKVDNNFWLSDRTHIKNYRKDILNLKKINKIELIEEYNKYGNKIKVYNIYLSSKDNKAISLFHLDLNVGVINYNDLNIESFNPNLFFHPEYQILNNFFLANKNSIVQLKDVAEFSIGRRQLPYEKQMPKYLCKEINIKNLRESSKEFINTEFLPLIESSNRKIIKKDAIIISLYRPFSYIKKFKQSNQEAVILGNDMVAIFPRNNEIDNIFNALNTVFTKIQFEINQLSGSIPRISYTSLKSTYINFSTKADFNQKSSEVDVALLLSTLKHSIMQKVPKINSIIDILELFVIKKLNNESKLTPTEKISSFSNINELLQHLKVSVREFHESFDAMNKIFSKNFSSLKPQKVIVSKIIQGITQTSQGTNPYELIIKGNLKFEAELDENLFKEVVLNLIDNAIKHGFKEPSKKYFIIFEILAKVHGHNDLYSIRYVNNGDPFPINYSFKDYISPGSKSELSKGTGLGGWIVNKIVEMHNGFFIEGNSGGVLQIEYKGQFLEIKKNVELIINLPKRMYL